MKKIMLSPSLICADILHLEAAVKQLEDVAVDSIHVDIIDGHFSPSMPLGLDAISKLKKVTKLPYDVHIMSNNCNFYIQEMISIGAERISFHIEGCTHIDNNLNMIKNAGLKCGVAITPSTPISALEYIIEKCDVVVLMLINPGFASNKNEQQVDFAERKIFELSELIASKNLSTTIQVDGRVSFDTIPKLVKAGADDLVLGSTSLFKTGHSLKDNKEKIESLIRDSLQEAQNEK